MPVRASVMGKSLGVIIVLVIVGVCGIWIVLYQSLPQSQGEVSLPGLHEGVSIRFDQWQRPFVQAATLGDALQAQGWLHAQNRLWQMELLRRAGQGRMAELLGADQLATDKALWRAGVPQLAAALEANSSAHTLALVDQYLAGVNGAVRQLRIPPPEFLLLRVARPHWQRRDVFALGALMAFQSANNMQNEMLRLGLAGQLDAERLAIFLFSDSEAGYPYVLPPPQAAVGLAKAIDQLDLTDPSSNSLMPRIGFGSNGWVLSAKKSASGVPLYAFDSHDELGLPNLFYEVHLFFGQTRQLRGWSVAGLPGVINGYNEYIAWGFTNTGDTQDLFLETRSADDALLFRDGSDWYRARTEIISIPVRDHAPESLTITYTRNGPLVSENPPISLAWTVHRITRPNLDSMLAFNLAQNWQQFTAAMDAFPAPTLNATYADIYGTIGFRTAGVLPLRGEGEGLSPLDGSVASNRWQGMVPAAQMPEFSNPGSGYLAAANARVNAGGDGPLVSADNAPPYRIARIQQVLGSKETFSVQDMQGLQMDWLDGQALKILPSLLQYLDPQRLDPTTTPALPLLQQWSDAPIAARDSAGALIFQQWYLKIAEAVFANDTAELYPRLLKRGYLLNHALDHLVLHEPSSPWWRGDRDGLLSLALNDAVNELSVQLGPRPQEWRLDQRQHVRLQHELGKAVPLLGWLFNQRDQPWGGSTATVARASYSYEKPFVVNSGATVRAVAEMSPVPRVWSVIPGGQSGHPLSQHYADQYPGWLAGELYPVQATPDGVGSVALRLVPAR